jgi:hypothetical protein
MTAMVDELARGVEGRCVFGCGWVWRPREKGIYHAGSN